MAAAREAEIDGLLAELRGGRTNWGRQTVSGAVLSAAIRKAALEPDGSPALTMVNAIVAGDVLLDGIGGHGHRLSLQMIGCEIRGQFRARASHWRQLAIARSAMRCIDLPRSQYSGDLALEDVTCQAWLELHGADIAGTLAITNSSFAATANHDAATELSEAKVGLSLKAHGLQAKGLFNAKRLKVAGNAEFDGALVAPADDSGIALDLSSADIGGELRLCTDGSRAFEARGIVVCMSATLGALVLRGASLLGPKQAALVADQLCVRHTVDIAGTGRQGDPPFTASGTLRFIGARIGGQFQLYLAKLDVADHTAVTLDSADIGGDAIFGQETSKLTLAGGLSAVGTKIGGRLVLTNVAFSAAATALLMREASVAGEVAIYQSTSTGAFRLDSLRANRFSIDVLSMTRAAKALPAGDFPEEYAHPEDALLDLSLARIAGNIHLTQLDLDGGDFRFINADIRGGIQIDRPSIRSPRRGLIGQGARLSSGFYVAGSPARPAVIEGDINLMSCQIDGDVTVVDAAIGTAAKQVEFFLRGTKINGNVNFTRVSLHGECNASATDIQQDFNLYGTQLSAPGATAFNISTARIGGMLTLGRVANADSFTDTALDGTLLAAGAEIGALEWYTLKLARDAKLQLTNMTLRRVLRAASIAPDGAGIIDLRGTSAGELADMLSDDEDGWGAGRLVLALDGFRYDRLSFPSGGHFDTPAVIRHWRSRWLARQADARSARPGRQLAAVLRSQGLYEASRLVLMDAFAAEGRASATTPGRARSWLFGLTFGHGLSGGRALLTLLFVWLIGAFGVMALQDRDLLVAEATQDGAAQSCGDRIDAFVYAADVMLPVLDLGEEKLCRVGPGPGAAPERAIAALSFLSHAYALSSWQIWRLAVTIYSIVGWAVVSLAIATWSGIFRRGGRE